MYTGRNELMWLGSKPRVEVAPRSAQSAMARAIASVFSKNLSLSEIFGVEYIMPMAAIPKAIPILAGLNVRMASTIPAVLVSPMNTHTCLLVDLGWRFRPRLSHPERSAG